MTPPEHLNLRVGLNNNNDDDGDGIYIAPYGRNFKGAGGRSDQYVNRVKA